MILIVGFSTSNRTGDPTTDYVPMSDGYRPGAEQVLVPLTVADDPQVTDAQWAEAVFVATNVPPEVHSRYPGAVAVAEAIARWGSPPAGFRSLSKGDTVIVNGALWACESIGFRVVGGIPAAVDVTGDQPA